jgi:hypothetical protein
MSTSSPPSRKVGTLALVALAVASLAGAAVVSRRFLAARPPTPALAPAKTIAAAGAPARELPTATFQVTAATGTVEAEHGGQWIAIKNGDTLTRNDVVRTAAGGHAVLRLSAGTEIELRERVEIGLDRLEGGATVDLRRGKVVARVSGSEGLEITSRDTKTANEGPAHFVVLSDDRGRVSVATLSGKAKFAAGGKALTLPEGTQSSSEGAGAAPSDPERIPEEVLLEVVWPAAEQRHGVETTEVSGRAAPSSVVTVNGSRAPVGADGHFTATVPLRTGKNQVAIEAEDLGGRTRQTAGTLVRRGPPPALTPETTDLWKK